MLKCEFCKDSFEENHLGLAEQLFHKIVHHEDVINK